MTALRLNTAAALERHKGTADKLPRVTDQPVGQGLKPALAAANSGHLVAPVSSPPWGWNSIVHPGLGPGQSCGYLYNTVEVSGLTCFWLSCLKMC